MDSAAMKPQRRRGERASRQRQKLWRPSGSPKSQQQQTNQQAALQPTRRRCVCPPDDCAPVKFPLIWSKLRSSQQLCDGAIRCSDGRVYPVHRAILSAVSPYFRATFTSCLGAQKEQQQQQQQLGHELVLPDVAGEDLGHVLDYAYTGVCRVGVDNVERLLPLADRLDVLGLVQLCCQFLLGELRPDNCLGIYKFAQHYFCQDLKEQGRRYVLRNFPKILQQSIEFRQLTYEELEPILRDDELNVRHEELVFEAIKVWIESDPKKRATHLPKLLNCPRYGLMRPGYFDGNIICWSLAQNIESKAVLLPIAGYLNHRQSSQQQQTQHDDSRARPRLPHEILFAIDGWMVGSPTNFIETYDTRADRWLPSSYTDAYPCMYPGVCALNNLIYVIGGSDGQQLLNNVRCFDPVAKVWRERACMYHARCYVSVCALDGKIYALGGNNGVARMCSCERYDPVANQWELIAPMIKRRSDAGCAVLNGRVYVAGGYDGYHLLRSAEVYDVATNQWTYIEHMSIGRSALSLVAFSGCLYAIGGFDGYSRLGSVERYNPSEPHKNWQVVTNMLHGRSNFATAVLDDLIFVIGGFDGTLPMSFVEYYDAENEDWCAAAPLNLSRSALRACVITGLTNVREYTYHRENTGQRESAGDVGRVSPIFG